MAVTKQKDGRWLVSCRPQGTNGPHLRRICKTRAEGKRLEQELMGQRRLQLDHAKLSVCVDIWFQYFGANLKDGEARKRKLLHIIKDIGDLRVSHLKPGHYLAYRKKRLDSGISPNTCNHDLVYLKTLFNKLVKAQYLSSNPLVGLAPLPLDEAELSYLTTYQIKRLLVSCRKSANESLFWVVLVCLATGARWSEVERLTFAQLSNNTIRFVKTKTRKNRTVPIDEKLYKALSARRRFGTVRIFANCLSAFRSAIHRAKITLPPGQMSHVLRHTFASHFIMNGGDIMVLQRILGHSNVKVTMRYAHMSRNHLEAALVYGPLNTLNKEVGFDG
ncbi:tyrosine-type recombinase/integrase [uncultured Pseudoteredinibacter sp.]|uniref:phage integrase n=1 Tax=uncultured Pseudoteredinibacter sp. TaxID=1641701 RepID=UPI0026394BAF|nr:tyrosine-type recombinase/integrase [uncultured Pseudoteredinibacter sp.]